MKQKLRLWACYALLEALFIITLLTSSMCADARAQRPEPSGPAPGFLDTIPPLQIGDTIPEALWHLPLQVVNHPEGKDSITLADHRGKLIILDFWATSCVPCIRAMPSVHAIQERFSGNVSVIPVSWSKPEVTLKMLRTHKSLAPLQIASVVQGEMLIKLFPHNVLPHYAWIAPSGEVVATTAVSDVSPSNIARVLRGERPDYTIKTHIDMEKPLLFRYEDLPRGAALQQYAVFIKGEIASLPSDVTYRRSGDTIHGVSVSNKRLLSMYQILARRMFGRGVEKRFSIVDSIADNDYYTFDFILPVGSQASFFSSLLDYLNQRSGYHGSWVKRSKKCLVLTKTRGKPRYISADGAPVYRKDADTIHMNFPMEDFTGRLDWPDISADRIVVDETGYRGSVNITLHGPFDDLDHIRKQLNAYGLDLVKAVRDVDIFELRKSSPNR